MIPVRARAAIITVCDGLVVRYLLHGRAAPPTDVAHLAAEALSSAL